MKVFHFQLVVVAVVSCTVLGQHQHSKKEEKKDEKKPVGIVKQINKINDDGSYTVGYEGEDGSFRLETRDGSGNVNGVYGYLDVNGKLQTVKYGAGNGTGFTAESDLIPKAPQPVAPPPPQSQHGGSFQPQQGGFPQAHHGHVPQHQGGGQPAHAGNSQPHHGGFPPQPQHGGFPSHGGSSQPQHGGFPSHGGNSQPQHGQFPQPHHQQQQQGPFPNFHQSQPHQDFQQPSFGVSSPRPQSEGFGQSFGGFPSNDGRHSGTSGQKTQDNPIQDFSLTGFSEDLDEDGFVDPLPTQNSGVPQSPQPVFQGQNSPFSQAQKLITEGKPFFGHTFDAPVIQHNPTVSDFGGGQHQNKHNVPSFPSAGGFSFVPPKSPSTDFSGGANSVDDSGSHKFNGAGFGFPSGPSPKPSFGGVFNLAPGFGGFGGSPTNNGPHNSQPGSKNSFTPPFRPNGPPSGPPGGFGSQFGSFGFPNGGGSPLDSFGPPVKTSRTEDSQSQGFDQGNNDFGRSFGVPQFDFHPHGFSGNGGGAPSVTEARVLGGSARFRQ